MNELTTVLVAYFGGLLPIYGMLFRMNRTLGTVKKQVDTNTSTLEDSGLRRDGGPSPPPSCPGGSGSGAEGEE